MLCWVKYTTVYVILLTRPSHSYNVPMSLLGVILRSVGWTAFNEGDTLRCYGTHSPINGCAGVVALVLVGLIRGNRVKVSEGMDR